MLSPGVEALVGFGLLSKDSVQESVCLLRVQDRGARGREALGVARARSPAPRPPPPALSGQRPTPSAGPLDSGWCPASRARRAVPSLSTPATPRGGAGRCSRRPCAPPGTGSPATPRATSLPGLVRDLRDARGPRPGRAPAQGETRVSCGRPASSDSSSGEPG